MQASADYRKTKGMQRRGNVRGCVGDALEITRPRRRAKATSATSMTPQTSLEISAGLQRSRPWQLITLGVQMSISGQVPLAGDM
jgi:hypothetical protein